MKIIETLNLLKTPEETKDFVECLKENLTNHSDKWYKMLKDIHDNDIPHYVSLSKGCKAAMEIYFALVEGGK